MKFTNQYVLYTMVAVVCIYGALESIGKDNKSSDDVMPEWHQCLSKTVPAARYIHAMAYDAGRKVTVLFGGSAGGGPNTEKPLQLVQDTWEWNGKVWVLKKLQTNPTARQGHAMVYVPTRKKIILFGGYDKVLGWLNDTWEYDGANWKRKPTATKPKPRYGHAMVYDSARDRIVLFGGGDEDSFDDTWEYDDKDWKEVLPATKPTTRRQHAMAYDVSRACTVLVSGYKDKGQLWLQDTWEWDGKDWKDKISDTQPPARACHGLVYDMARNKCLLFGGLNPASGALNDTWEYDGTNWVQSSGLMPPVREALAVAYDSVRYKTILFGGYNRDVSPRLLNDTWEYGGK
ncbi:MAG: hypothetical protein HY762_01800 [Planctomycetes bacterium]|nr:hypothetical protein [Planctomycetota bacterium]